MSKLHNEIAKRKAAELERRYKESDEYKKSLEYKLGEFDEAVKNVIRAFGNIPLDIINFFRRIKK